MDTDSILRDKWIAEYRARWAAQRAATSVSTGDGGAWLEGDAARATACDAMLVPVVTGDVDPGAIEDLITACVQYHQQNGRRRTGATSWRVGKGADDPRRVFEQFVVASWDEASASTNA